MKILNKKIGIDFDDVIVDFSSGFINFINNRLGLYIKKEHIVEYEITKILNIPKIEIIKLYDDFYKSQNFKQLNLIQNSIKGIYKLAQNNDIYIITARNSKFYEETIASIRDIFNSNIKSIHFTNNNGYRKLKSDICNSLNIDIFIDDSLENILDVYKNTTSKVYVFDQPWNRYKLPNKVKRIYSLEELI